LAGLPKEYSVLVTILGTLKQTQTLDELLPSMLQMEQQIRADERETLPIYGARDGIRRKQPRQNQQHNSRSDIPRFQGSCHYCGKKGHMEPECRTRKQDQQGIRTVAYGASAVGASSDDWVIDSGASKHLTPHRQHLRNYRNVAPNSAVTFFNGHQAAAVGQGEVILRVQTASGCTDVTLGAVLQVPEATVNLFSTRQAMNSGAQITFRDNRCFVSSDDTMTMEGVSQRDGTMVIRQSRQQPTYALAATTAAKQSPELWHMRFGHLGYDNLFKLKNKHMVEGISVPAEAFKEQQQQQKPFCEECTMAKQHRLPFPDSGSSSSSLLELVHIDVCGPLQVKSTGDARYLATFIDDYSRLCHVVPLGYKSEAAQAVRATISLWETQTGNRLKADRTDRGTEYVNSELETYFSDKGVIHNTIAPYTPEQNGAAERFNRTLMERVRAMLLDAKLGSEHWADAASTATYVKNRSSSSHSSQTPWELFFGRKSDVSGMRVFGSKTYVHVPKQLRRKLDPLSIAGIFVGYEPNSKAYRVLMDSGKVQISRDVIFLERVPSAANKAAASEAEQANNKVSARVPDRPITVQEDNSEADSTGIDLGPTYSTDSEAEAEATQAATEEAEPAAEDTAATSAQETQQSCFPQRERKQPKQIYKAQAAMATELEEPQTYAEAMRAPDAPQWKLAMDEEMTSLRENSTWTLEQQP